MKYTQRLDYARLAEVLHDRGMADPGPLGEMLQSSIAGGTPFAEAVVYANLVSDWDLSRVVCEIFNLAFVTADICTPDLEAAQALDVAFLMQHGLVPMGRFGQVLTLAMPGLVPADVLGLLAAQSDLVIQPVVGTVMTNRRWIEAHLHTQPQGALAGGPLDGTWQNIFDDADAAVQLDLEEEEVVGELDIDRELAQLEAEGMTDIEIAVEEEDFGDEFPAPPRSAHKSAGPADPKDRADISLPPMPDFNLGDEPAA